MTSENFRNPITDQEKAELIQALSKNQEVVLQIESEVGKVPLKVTGIDNQFLLVLPRNSTTKNLMGVKSLQFVFERSRFESEVNVSIHNQGSYALEFYKPIYKIQRRQNFRTDLPKTWTREILVDQINDDLVKVQGTIIDLSLTGCFFTTENPGLLMADDNIYGEMTISDFRSVRFKAQVMRGSKRDQGQQGFGLKFTEIDGIGTQTLNAITLKAAREMRNYTHD